MQRAQSDDRSRHAGLRSNPLIPNPADRCRSQAVSCTKAIGDGHVIGVVIASVDLLIEDRGGIRSVKAGRWSALSYRYAVERGVNPITEVFRTFEDQSDSVVGANVSGNPHSCVEPVREFRRELPSLADGMNDPIFDYRENGKTSSLYSR
jgi:hypothetical protein